MDNYSFFLRKSESASFLKIIGAVALVFILQISVASASEQAGKFPAPQTEEASPKPNENPIANGNLVFKLIGEFGFLAPVSHRIQFGKNGDRFNYITEGGQDNLFPAGRISSELFINRSHSLIFLYQPLNIESRVLLQRDIVVDGLLFPEGTPLDLRYGFDFFRLSYAYDFLDQSEEHELSLGFSMQIRNATIDFTSADGKLRRSNRNIGPVPLIKLRGRWRAYGPLWLGAEVDGIYAPIKFINGSDSDVVGALVDASLRAGLTLGDPLDIFFNFRYIWGGAEGTSKNDTGPGDGYNSNWLQFIIVSIGAEFSVTEFFRNTED